MNFSVSKNVEDSEMAYLGWTMPRAYHAQLARDTISSLECGGLAAAFEE
jgi:hypothetical protein